MFALLILDLMLSLTLVETIDQIDPTLRQGFVGDPVVAGTQLPADQTKERG